MSGLPAWMGHASCRGLSEFFFPELGEFAEPARRVCAVCPVLEECRAWNDELENRSVSAARVFGVYGGESPKQRIARRRTQRKSLKAVVA